MLKRLDWTRVRAKSQRYLRYKGVAYINVRTPYQLFATVGPEVSVFLCDDGTDRYFLHLWLPLSWRFFTIPENETVTIYTVDSPMSELTQAAFPQSINWFKSAPSTTLPICIKLMGFSNFKIFSPEIGQCWKDIKRQEMIHRWGRQDCIGSTSIGNQACNL